VYFKSPWSLSHSKAMCLLALAIACLMFIVTKPGQKVTQDPHIHYRVILNPWALLPNRWAFKLARFHGHIVACPQMLYHVVLGCIRCIAPINPAKQVWAHPLLNGHPLWQLEEGQPYLLRHALWQLEEGNHI
jgi:hypothetical protein